MAVVSNRYNRSRYVVSRYEFQHGGDGDSYLCNFVGDSRQAFGVPAKSLMIQNHAGGAGDNYLYFRTIHDKTLGSSPPAVLGPDEFINYQLGETVFWAVLLWASNANLVFSLDATPGEWTDAEIAQFESSPFRKSTQESIDRISLLSGVDLSSMEI